jgi:hypothetical protein
MGIHPEDLCHNDDNLADLKILHINIDECSDTIDGTDQEDLDENLKINFYPIYVYGCRMFTLTIFCEKLCC